MAVAPGSVLQLCFGPEAVGGTTPLLALAIGNIVFVLCGNNGLALQMTGHQRVSMYIGLITSSLYLASLPFAIEMYGVAGAAWCASSLLIVRNLASTWLVRAYVGVWPTPLLWLNRLPQELKSLKQYPPMPSFPERAVISGSALQ
jgi:O-antigen/teichoic acid export membrane protein